MNILPKKSSLFRVFHILLVNFAILSAGIFLIEFIFGNWRHSNGMKLLNISHNVEIERDVSEAYPSKTGKITYKRDEYGLRGTFTDVS